MERGVDAEKVAFAIWIIVILSWVSVSQSFAADQTDATADLENRWWENNVIVKKTRFHAEISGSYSKSSGNYDSTTKTATAEITVRKLRATNYLFYTLADQKSVLSAGRGSLKQKKWVLRESIRYLFYRNAYVAVGFERQKDESAFIDKMQILYGGVGASLQPNKQHNLSFLTALGREDRKYAGSDSSGSNGVYINQSYTWHINRMLILKQSGYLLKYFATGFGKRWNFNISLDVLLAPHFYLNIAFTRNWNESDIQELLGINEKDDLQVVGLKFTY